MQIVVDSELRYRINEPDAQPLVFEPQVNWETFTEPNIIYTY
jgi:hypothetical protein